MEVIEATGWLRTGVALFVGVILGVLIMALMQMAGGTECPDDSGDADPADAVR